jgi:hypothetical protein
MADRLGFQFIQSIVPGLAIYDGYFAAGPDGYVNVSNGTDQLPLWMKSITRTGTGAYAVVTGINNSTGAVDYYARLFPFINVVGAGSSSHLVAQLTVTTPSGFSFVLENSTTGTATDLSLGSGLQITVHAHNSTVQ